MGDGSVSENDLAERDGDALIALLMDSVRNGTELKESFPGETANELLGRLHQGFPVERILPLLEGEHQEGLGHGLFLISELGERLSPIATDLVRLLARSRDSWGVARAVSTDLFELSELSTPTIAAIVRLLPGLNDPRSEADDGEVLFCALRVLRRARPEQLGEVAVAIDDDRLSELLTWLHDVSSDPNQADQIEDRLAGDDLLAVVFAVAAAARIAGDVGAPLRRVAAESTEPAIRDFARNELGLGQQGRARWNL